MIRKNSIKRKVILAIIIVLFVFQGINTYINSKHKEEFNKYSQEIKQYTDKLNKYAFGDYEKSYKSLLDKSDNMIRKDQINKINQMKKAFQQLDSSVEQGALSTLNQSYNDIANLDMSKLDVATLAKENKDIQYVRILIDKKFYRIAYNECNRIKNEVAKGTEAKIKEEQAAAEAAKANMVVNQATSTATPVSDNGIANLQ